MKIHVRYLVPQVSPGTTSRYTIKKKNEEELNPSSYYSIKNTPSVYQ